MAITDNRYCNRQFLQLAGLLLSGCPVPVGLDVVGCRDDRDIVTLDEYDPFQYLQDLISILDWIERFRDIKQ
ncbi:MAG: hypothetical protein IJH64_08610 [Oscillospiraceae bacterium]|nr:hypothetical protein [Oscillospiraceae bacterium]